jgi:phage terminase small subunit
VCKLKDITAMKRGPKPQLPAIKIQKGTFQPCRDANRVELIAPDELPKKPDWLTSAGEEVWMDDVGRVSALRLASEADTTMFANYCNLQGMIIMAWRSLSTPDYCPPPIAAISQATKMQEYFGIAGGKSRVVKVESRGPSGNPYDKFKR